MGKRYGKLVRDRIPKIIEAEGGTAVTHVADAGEYAEKLSLKLMEESEEFAMNPSMEELADVLEVVEALIEHHGYHRASLVALMREKRERRGGFEGRIILDEVP
ncbi:hypothetical protein EDM68_03185 [Candidatus Uhrbacteria bacterium]|nr:MAG: hypothetical protein EDM68_03185 [Candidatus Uhrbacteria bacterium]